MGSGESSQTNIFFSESVPRESWCKIFGLKLLFLFYSESVLSYELLLSFHLYKQILFFFAEEPVKQEKNCPNPIKWGGLTGKRNKVALKKGGSAKIAVHPRGQPIYGHLQQTLYFCVFFCGFAKIAVHPRGQTLYGQLQQALKISHHKIEIFNHLEPMFSYQMKWYENQILRCNFFWQISDPTQSWVCSELGSEWIEIESGKVCWQRTMANIIGAATLKHFYNIILSFGRLWQEAKNIRNVLEVHSPEF